MKMILKDSAGELHVVADSAVGRSGQPWFLPDFGSDWRWRQAVGLRVSRLGKGITPKFAGRYFDAVTVLWVAEADGFDALDFMDGRVVCGEWLPLDSVEWPQELADMLVEASRYATLKNGDVVAAVTAGGARPIVAPSTVSLRMGNTETVKFNIK